MYTELELSRRIHCIRMDFLPPSVTFGFCSEGEDSHIPKKHAQTGSEEHN